MAHEDWRGMDCDSGMGPESVARSDSELRWRRLLTPNPIAWAAMAELGIQPHTLTLPPRRSPWVLVSEELPQYPVDVLVTVREPNNTQWTRVGRFVPALKGDPIADHRWWVDGTVAENVIAWMPFPQPYQER